MLIRSTDGSLVCRADARLPRLCGFPQGQGQISGLPPCRSARPSCGTGCAAPRAARGHGLDQRASRPGRASNGRERNTRTEAHCGRIRASERLDTPLPGPDSRPLYIRGHRNTPARSLTSATLVRKSERARTSPQLAGLSLRRPTTCRPSTQCAACTIDLTGAGKGYAATGRRAELTRPGAPGRDVAPGLRAVRDSKGTRTPARGAGQQTPRPRPRCRPRPGTGTGRHHHPPGPPAPGPTPGRKNRRRYALITAARRPRINRPLLPAPRALTRAAGPEESRRRCGRFGQ